MAFVTADVWFECRANAQVPLPSAAMTIQSFDCAITTPIPINTKKSVAEHTAAQWKNRMFRRRPMWLALGFFIVPPNMPRIQLLAEVKGGRNRLFVQYYA
jgi:hypothetical protein